ncbi:MAG: MraY family glycosyltransferase [Thermodesulfobacteriota bacterium]
MTTLLFAFIFAWILGLILTPLVRRLGHACGVLDTPGGRKVHTGAIPRIGGVAVLLAHVLGLFLTMLLGTDISNLLDLALPLSALWIGGLAIFGVGLFDDCRRLKAWIKLAVQILAVSLAFAGGVAIDPGGLTNWIPFLDPAFCSYILTVFWFVLLINAMNLIDGLDGLAGGIAFFVCLVLSVLQVVNNDFLLALYFITLAGSVAGFLFYNFNPATIFLGDCGSYYLGYMIAGLSVLGSVKSQVGVTLTLPLLAMGVPVFDTLFAPLRRIFLGRGPFQPDRQHLHHKLMAMGFSARRAVLTLYAVTAGLCIAALVAVNIHDEQSGLLLVLLAVGVIVVLNGLGYFRYVDREKLESWLRDVGFVTGLHRDRRRFLDLQIKISRCRKPNELWQVISDGLEMLDFDYGEMRLDGKVAEDNVYFTWIHQNKEMDLSADGLFKLELPLQCREEESFGNLWLVKDLERSSLTHYTLTRIEHMRRAILRCLLSWKDQSGR